MRQVAVDFLSANIYFNVKTEISLQRFLKCFSHRGPSPASELHGACGRSLCSPQIRGVCRIFQRKMLGCELTSTICIGVFHCSSRGRVAHHQNASQYVTVKPPFLVTSMGHC